MVIVKESIKMKQKIKNGISYFLWFLMIVIVVSSSWLVNQFGTSDFEQYLYHLFGPKLGSNNDIFLLYFKQTFPTIIGVFVVILVVYFIIRNYFAPVRSYLLICFRNQKRKILIPDFSFLSKHILPISFLVLLLVCYSSLKEIGFVDYVLDKSNYSQIYEDYYVEPTSSVLSFPEKKRNLILIYVESLENSYTVTMNDGNEKVNIIPKLTEIADKNINFSNSEELGGAYPVPGTGWTVAGIFSSMSGLPLTANMDYNTEEKYNSFMPGATILGDILKEEGYNQKFILGSSIEFANKNTLFEEHGNYEILDYLKAKEAGLIPGDYRVWWGYEDSKVFEYAKDSLLELSSKEEPFNLTILTSNTHFVGGYLEDSCSSVFEDAYSNSILCFDSMIGNFISWIEEQDFYDNTTIVITGDHLTMDQIWAQTLVGDSYERTIFNTFINSTISPVETQNRVFTQLDLFPTILASMGAEIDGERLGLGTNLFSDTPTLAEELGFQYFYDQLSMNSRYYNNHFVYDILD